MKNALRRLLRILNILIVVFIPFIPEIINKLLVTEAMWNAGLDIFRLVFIMPLVYFAAIIVLTRQRLGSSLYPNHTGRGALGFWVVKLSLSILGFCASIPILWSNPDNWFLNYKICLDTSIYFLFLLLVGLAEWIIRWIPAIRGEMSSNQPFGARLLLTAKALILPGVAARKHLIHKLIYGIRILCWIPIVLNYLAGLRNFVFLQGVMTHGSVLDYLQYWGALIADYPTYIPLVVLRLAELVFFDRD